MALPQQPSGSLVVALDRRRRRDPEASVTAVLEGIALAAAGLAELWGLPTPAGGWWLGRRSRTLRG